VATVAPITPIDYTSRDYASLREDLIKAVQLRIPQWTADDPTDFGLAIVEAFAYMGDIMSYYIDRAANETFLSTATQRESISAIAKTLGYFPASARSSSVRLKVYNAGQTRARVIPGTKFVCNVSTTDQTKMLTFEARRPAGSSTSVAPTAPFIIKSFQDDETNIIIEVVGDAFGDATGDETEQIYQVGDTLEIRLTGNTNIDGQRVLTSGLYDDNTDISTLYFATSGTEVPLVDNVTTNATLVAINSILADEGSTDLNVLVGVSDGSPDQEFTFRVSSLIEDSVTVICGTPSNTNNNVPVGVDSADLLYGVYRYGYPVWSTQTNYIKTTSTSNLGPYDNIFYLDPKGGGQYAIRFGDGNNGTIPSKDSGIYVTYRVGGGIAGNIPANKWMRGPGLLTASSETSGYGGANEESIEEIRKNASAMFRSRDRAVSNQDFADLALTDSLVTKANARSGSSSSTAVYIAPASAVNDLAPGYVSYKVTRREKTGTLATLTVSGMPTSLIDSGSFTGYVSGIGSDFDSHSVLVNFSVINGTQVTYTAPVSGTVADGECVGIVTEGITSAMETAVTRVKSYIEARCNAGMTVTVSPIVYRDASVDVTVYLKQGTRRSVGMRKAKDTLVDLFSYLNASIAGTIRTQDILMALSETNEIAYSETNELRFTSDTSPTDTSISATSGEIIRLLTGSEYWTVSGTSIDTFTTGNIVVRLGGDTGIADF
jgi:hypothetical protein